LCEEFDCLPSQALREYLRAPDGFLEQVIEAKAYAAAKRLYEEACAAGRASDLSVDGLVGDVMQNEAELVQEALKGG
jgi:hypothetical protein